VKVRIKRSSNAQVPVYATAGAAGCDLCSTENVTVGPLATALVPTGIFLEVPMGFEAQIRTRSGLALKQGLVVLNSPGTIDSDYRGEVKVIIYNASNEWKKINAGDRIAQMVIARVEHALFEEVEELSDTARGSGGFGSTGK